MPPIDGTWRNPAIRRCYGKIASRDWNSAELRAERASIRTGDLIVAYRCYDCGWFHIGHADQLQKRIREERLKTVNMQCPRCGDLIDDARRYETAESGNTYSLLLVKVPKKSGEKRRRANRLKN
jgi:predicted RNA-binding Zn-ribbon protein involved in translation (DUF1610 family)